MHNTPYTKQLMSFTRSAVLLKTKHEMRGSQHILGPCREGRHSNSYSNILQSTWFKVSPWYCGLYTNVLMLIFTRLIYKVVQI
jgi:hypothetical protein